MGKKIHLLFKEHKCRCGVGVAHNAYVIDVRFANCKRCIRSYEMEYGKERRTVKCLKVVQAMEKIL